MKKIFVCFLLLYFTQSFVFWGGRVYAQLPVCSGPGSGLIYYISIPLADTLYTLNPQLPFSATNPSHNSIPMVGGGGIAASSNLNATSPAYTFYTVSGTGTFYYYNGTSWVNTGHFAGTGGGNGLGAGGGYVYSLGTSGTSYAVYRYDGTSNAILLTTIATNTQITADITADCAGNFYLLNLTDTIQWMREYNSNGTLINSWTVSGAGHISTGVSLSIIGNRVYTDSAAGYLRTGIISGSNINFTTSSSTFYPATEQDWASCPSGVNVAVASIDTAYYCTGGVPDTLIAYGAGSYTWAVLSGPATISGSGDTVTVTATGNADIILSSGVLPICGSDSDTVHIIVAPQASISTNANPVCTGDSLQLSAGSNSNPINYLWHGPNNFSATSYNPTLYNIQFNDSGYYSVTETLNICSSKDSVFVGVKQNPNVPTASSNSPVCAGDSLKLTVGNVQSGVNYSWSGPGGFISSVYNPVRLNAQTSYSGNYTVTANLNGCMKFAITNATVNPILGPPTISIAAQPDTICVNQNVTLSAISTNAGSPQYHWRKNGAATGPNAASYTTGNVANGDIFSCEVSSGSMCQPVDTAGSNSVKIDVVYNPPPIISVTMFPLVYAGGDTVTFTGHVPAGNTSYTYYWKKNGVVIPNANTSIYTSNSVQAGDTICLVVHSPVPCTIPDSSVECVGLEPLGVSSEQRTVNSLKVWPNPVTNVLHLESSENVRVSMTSIEGKVLLRDCFVPRNDARGINIERFAKEVYFLEVIYRDGSREVRKIIKE